MRFLSDEEIGTITIGNVVSESTFNGLDEKGIKPLKILVERVNFKLDEKHSESSIDGEWSGYKISLLINNEVQETIDERYFTDCTESEVFLMVGNYMGTAFMRNVMDDFYYLNNIIYAPTGQRQKWTTEDLEVVILPTDSNGVVILDGDEIAPDILPDVPNIEIGSLADEVEDDEYEDFMDDVKDMVDEDHEKLMNDF